MKNGPFREGGEKVPIFEGERGMGGRENVHFLERGCCVGMAKEDVEGCRQRPGRAKGVPILQGVRLCI